MKHDISRRYTTVTKKEKEEAKIKHPNRTILNFGVECLELFLRYLVEDDDYEIPTDICVVVTTNKKPESSNLYYQQNIVQKEYDREKHTIIFFVEVVIKTKDRENKILGLPIIGEGGETRYYYRGGISVSQYNRYTEHFFLEDEYCIPYSILDFNLITIPKYDDRINYIRKINVFDSGLRFLNRVQISIAEVTEGRRISSRFALLEEIHAIKARNGVIDFNQSIERHLYQRYVSMRKDFDTIHEETETASLILLLFFVFRYEGNFKTYKWFIDTELVLFNARLEYLFKHCTEKEIYNSLCYSDLFGYEGIELVKLSRLKPAATEKVRKSVLSIIKRETKGKYSESTRINRENSLLETILDDILVESKEIFDEPISDNTLLLFSKDEIQEYRRQIQASRVLHGFFNIRYTQGVTIDKVSYKPHHIISCPLSLFFNLKGVSMVNTAMFDKKIFFDIETLKPFLRAYYEYKLRKDEGSKKLDYIIQNGFGMLKEFNGVIKTIRSAVEDIVNGKRKRGLREEDTIRLPDIEDCVSHNLFPLCELSIFWKLKNRVSKHLLHFERMFIIYFLFEAGFWYNDVTGYLFKNDKDAKKYKGEMDPRKSSRGSSLRVAGTANFQYKDAYTTSCSFNTSSGYTQHGAVTHTSSTSEFPEQRKFHRSNYDNRHGCPYHYLKDEMMELEDLIKDMGIKDYRKRETILEKAKIGEPMLACKLAFEILHGVTDDNSIVKNPTHYFLKALKQTNNGSNIGTKANTITYNIFDASKKQKVDPNSNTLS
jgi:hypothetical protein